MSALLQHWEIKLIALVMAVTLYLFTSDLTTVYRRLSVPLLPEHIVGLPEGRWQFLGIDPPELALQVQGPIELMRRLDEQGVRPRLVFDETRVADGRQVFEAGFRLLQLDPTLRLDFPAGDTVVVRVERIVTDTIAVQGLPEFVGLPDGLLLGGITLDRSSVPVVGAESAVAALKAAGPLPVDPVRLDDLDAELTEAVTRLTVLQPRLPPDVRMVDSAGISATVTVRPAPGERRLQVPVRVLMPPEAMERYTVELHAPQVVVLVRGPRNRLETLDPERSLAAYVDLTVPHELDIPLAMPVRVDAAQAPWARVVDAGTIRVTVRARGRQAPPPRVEDEERDAEPGR